MVRDDGQAPRRGFLKTAGTLLAAGTVAATRRWLPTRRRIALPQIQLGKHSSISR